MRVVLILALLCIPLSAQSTGDLPKDVYPDSRSRLPLVKRENLSEPGKKAYDTAAANAPSGRPDGAVAIRLHRSGADLRWESPVGRALSELAIISTAREHDQPWMGNYAGTATRLSAFNQQMPPGWKQFRRCRSRRRPIFIRTREAGFR